MAEFGVAVVGGGFALAAAGYTAGTGFVARHETAHAQQVGEMKRLFTDFEEGYVKGEVAEDDWQRFLTLREQARGMEVEYEESIEHYKGTSVYQFVRKWKKMRQVRKKKNQVRKLNKELRSHYYDSTSDASDTSSVAANSGSPPRSRMSRYSDDDGERILSWAKGVDESDDEHMTDNNPAMTVENETRITENHTSPLCAVYKHEGPIAAISISPRSDQILSISSTLVMRSWNVETGSITAIRSPQCNSHNICAISPNGRLAVSATPGNGFIQIWDTETMKNTARTLANHTNEINSVAFSCDGHFVASASDDLTVRIWSTMAGGKATLTPLVYTSPLASVAFSSNTSVVAGSSDNTINIWDARMPNITFMEPLTGHTGRIDSVTFSPDSTRIASGSRDKTVRVWDAQTGAVIGQPLKGHTDWVTSVAFSFNGNRIVSGSDDGNVCVWDVKTGGRGVAPRLLRGHENWVNSVTFSSDDRFILSGSDDHTVRLWYE